jgi:mRNA interferase MazF
MQRGEVWWAQVNERCPVVVLAQDGPDKIRGMIVVAPASASIDGYALEVGIGHDEGLPLAGVLRVALPRPGKINCNWLVTLSRSALLDQVGVVSREKLHQIDEMLRLGQLDRLLIDERVTRSE